MQGFRALHRVVNLHLANSLTRTAITKSTTGLVGCGAGDGRAHGIDGAGDAKAGPGSSDANSARRAAKCAADCAAEIASVRSPVSIEPIAFCGGPLSSDFVAASRASGTAPQWGKTKPIWPPLRDQPTRRPIRTPAPLPRAERLPFPIQAAPAWTHLRPIGT